jgi:integrase
MTDFSEAWEAAKRRTADKENRIPAVVCRWHDLRHTFCTRLVESGQGLAVLAVLMGWSAATTVRMARRYGHLSGETLSAAVAVLDNPKTASV